MTQKSVMSRSGFWRRDDGRIRTRSMIAVWLAASAYCALLILVATVIAPGLFTSAGLAQVRADAGWGLWTFVVSVLLVIAAMATIVAVAVVYLGWIPIVWALVRDAGNLLSARRSRGVTRTSAVNAAPPGGRTK